MRLIGDRTGVAIVALKGGHTLVKTLGCQDGVQALNRFSTQNLKDCRYMQR